MRWANFVEGLLFMIGYLLVCLVVLTSRPLQPAPARRTVSTSRRTGIAG
jgi:hypothetical protein